jgi:hypothetical protein
MNQAYIIDALSDLGSLMATLDANDAVIQQNSYKNQWFTVENQLYALKNWSKQLTTTQLSEFASIYQFKSEPKIVGIIMAGNVPLVGLHDLVCVLLSGNIAQIKLSKDDEILPRFLIQHLVTNFPLLKDRLIIVDKLADYQAAIATGSNNSSRYFEYYFRGVPHIIRKNRTSVAILDKDASEKERYELAEDIFRYYGLGCRNVGKIYLPEGYPLPDLLDHWNHWFFLSDQNKYFNNYTYHKALLLMNLEPHFDNGFLTLKESESIFSPLGCLFYEFYNDPTHLDSILMNHKDDIQCIMGRGDNRIPFGKAQLTQLNDFADGIDTMKFLESI